jgi:hypothetical protein
MTTISPSVNSLLRAMRSSTVGRDRSLTAGQGSADTTAGPLPGRRRRDCSVLARRLASRDCLGDIPIAAGEAREPSREASAPEPAEATLHR